MRRPGLILLGGLVAANAACWLWAVALFHDRPVLLGTALLAWGLGLRHAVDADHIAAIDNVTRKLMAEGGRPVSVGFFFALGHSTVVILAAGAVAATTAALAARFDGFREIGGAVGTTVSALFLFAIAAVNIVILRGVWAQFRAVRRGVSVEIAPLPGVLGRVMRPLFGMIRRGWHMYPLGFLFGLGFDTATEVSLLGVSATQAADGLGIASILVFPALFTAGMSLIDTADGLLMMGAYDWALARPLRRVTYNLAVTALSVAVAVVVGGIELADLLSDRFAPDGVVAAWAGPLADHLTGMGFAVVAAFALIWAGSAAMARRRG